MNKALSVILPALGCLAGLATASAQSAAPTITVEATLAPNFFGSPSFDAWAANGIYAAENGLTTYGAPGPTQFNVIGSPLPVYDNLVTDYTSWEGVADPAAPYDSEYGTRASFVSIINGNGGLISISQMGFIGTSSDAGNALGFSYPNNDLLPGDWNYDTYDIGIINNPDGSTTIVNDADGSVLVNEIISIGAGNAYTSSVGDLPPPATDQQTLDADAASIPGYTFTGEFTYGDSGTISGSATADFVSTTPDSSSILVDALILAGLMAAGVTRPKRRAIRF